MRSPVFLKIHHQRSWLNQLDTTFPLLGLAVALPITLTYFLLPAKVGIYFSYIVNFALHLPGFYVRLVQRAMLWVAIGVAGRLFYFLFFGWIFLIPLAKRKISPLSRERRPEEGFFSSL